MAQPKEDGVTKDSSEYSYQLSDSEWKKKLSSQQYKVLRKKATEPATTGKYDKFYPKNGYFVCVGCGQKLYSSKSKYNSGSGWPAFDKCYRGSVDTISDRSHGWNRIEILCSNCGGHLGHVFKDGTHRSNHRHCVNSASLKYKDEQEESDLDEQVLDLSKSTAKKKGQSSNNNTDNGCILM